MLILKQSTSIDIRMGPFVDSTDGVTPETGVTLGAADQAEVLKANGAATVAMAGTFAAVTGADGWYDYTASTSDTDTVGEVVFVVQDSSVCLPVFTRAYVVEEVTYDAMFAASATAFDANGRVDVGEWLGNAVTFGTGGPDVNVNAISDDTTAAANLELDYDGTGYNKTNSTIGTLTTNSDKTGYSISGTKTTLDALNDISTADVNAQCDTALSDIGLDHLLSASVVGTDVTDNSVIAKLVSASATADWDDFINTTDSLQAIRDRGDAAWTTGGGGSSPILLQNTTIATLASQTSFTLTAGSADDDAYNGMICVVTDQSTSTQKAVGKISDYTGSTKTVTLKSDPAIFTMAVGDTIDIVAVNDNVTLVDTTTANTDMRGTDSAALAANYTAARAGYLDNINGHTPQTGDTYPLASGANGFANIKSDTAATLTDTNELQGDWTNGGRLDLILDDILTDTGTTIPAQISALNNLSAAQVNAEMVDVLNVDLYSELTGIPAASTTLTNMIRLNYSLSRNKTTQTATTFTLRNDADSGNIGTATVSDDGTTATKGEMS